MCMTESVGVLVRLQTVEVDHDGFLTRAPQARQSVKGFKGGKCERVRAHRLDTTGCVCAVQKRASKK